MRASYEHTPEKRIQFEEKPALTPAPLPLNEAFRYQPGEAFLILIVILILICPDLFDYDYDYDYEQDLGARP